MIVQEAMKESAQALLEITEFEIATINVLNKKLRKFISETDGEERLQIQGLFETHLKQVAKKEADIPMIKLAMNFLLKK